MKTKILISIILIIILATIGNAEIFSVDPCGETTAYESGSPTHLFLENACLKVELTKNPYNPNIDFYDKVHDESFRLHLMGLEERNLNSPFQTSTTTFASMGLTGASNGDTISYTNGQTTIGYKLQGRQLKAQATINNFPYTYSNSDLWVETKYQTSSQGTVIHTAPEVDGLTKPIQTESRVAGLNTFYLQKLGRGNNIILDPIYTVDYSPIPATWLQDGILETDPDSNFVNETDITSGVSDNNTATQYETKNTPNWWNLSFQKRKTINITNVGSTTLSNFPAYLNITKESDMQADFDDLRFINADCNEENSTLLDYEIENYTSTNAHVWIRIPTLDTGTKGICMYYNNTGASNGEDVTGVWDSGYMVVHHLDGASVLELLDSTQYENNMSFAENSPAYNSVGIIGNAVDFSGTTERISMTDSATLDLGGDTLTMQAWIQPDFDETGTVATVFDKRGAGIGSGGYRIIFIDAENDFRFLFDDGVDDWFEDTSGISFNADEWHHIATTYNGSEMKIYWDGEELVSGAGSGNVSQNALDLAIGGNTQGDAYFDGTIDETRISNVSRTPDWINQSYQIVADQSNIVSFGEETTDIPRAITGRWNQTYDSNYTWFARIRKETSTTAQTYIYAYDDEDNISNQFVSTSLAGTGWKNINVSSLLDYQLNTQGLDFSSLRIWTDISTNFSEVTLRKEIDDATPPTIEECHVASASIDCNEDPTWICTITDLSDVNTATYTINGQNYSATQNDSEWYATIPFLDIITLTNPTMTDAYATDLFDQEQYNSTNLAISNTCQLSIILEDARGLNGTLSGNLEFNTSNLEEIEYLRLNFTIDSNKNISSWYFNFTADGFGACSLGNKQNDICYEYPDWIQFRDGIETATYDGAEGNILGDIIVVNETGNETNKIITLTIDEHYNPNVFKWYNALFNFSNVKWQNATDQRLTSSNMIKIELDPNKIPLNADQYKIDARVLYEGNPTQPIVIYACNSSYVAGTNHSDPMCSLVASKMPSELTETGTKIKGIFTKALIDELGDIKYLLFMSHDSNTSNYYYLKTFKAKATNYTTHWEYTNDLGGNWTNLADGYETEVNINWFYDGAEPTTFRYRLVTNITSEFYLEGNVTWDIDAVANYPPISHITAPFPSTTINLPYNITFTISDPNDDALNASLKLYVNTDLNETIAENMNENNSTFNWNSTALGTFSLVLEVCETNTTDLYCVNDTHPLTITDACIESWQPQGTCLINDTVLRTYTDANACGTTDNLPADNGTYVACNYCSQDLYQVIQDCSPTEIQSVSYIDMNYTTCCQVTGELSDCAIDFTPYNETTQQSCNFFTKEFNCSIDPAPILNKKINIQCVLPDSTTRNCVVNTYQRQNNTRVLLATSPEYSSPPQASLISIFPKDTEVRTSFTTTGLLLNAYYTTKELRPETDYELEVICSDTNETIVFTSGITPVYHTPDETLHRAVWITENATFIIVLSIVIILVIIGVILVIRKARKR